MKYQRLKQIILFAGITCIVYIGMLPNLYAEIYESGKIAVWHEELSVKRDGQPVQFDHPSELPGNTITNILSYVFFEKKGLLHKKGSLRVFQDDEIRTLVPLIVQAFSVAKPNQAVVISSYSERMFLTDLQNFCILFISDHYLNIVFSRVHTLQTYNDYRADKKKYTLVRKNPLAVKRSHFWRLIPSAGQQLEPKHENWLVVDVSYDMYQKPIVRKTDIVDEKIKMGTADIDTRLRRLEEMMRDDGMGNTADHQSETAEPSSSASETYGDSEIKSKLMLLREMVTEGIISENDYDYKKIRLLREVMGDMSIRDQLREIKELKSEGLITEEDYHERKKELLDQF
ncbi:MAG: SHOCT domain-containing protein [wastewater metagenome]|nr:SHOCT domain-containing protein [Candidatus Loosdrechtia aerotolerans]